jgi:hypothetical protein
MDPTPPPPASPNSLDYGPRPRLHRRPFLRRIAIVAILITAIAFSIYQIRSHWPALKMYYLQHQCLTHPIPPGIQVYSFANPSATFKSPEFDAFVAQFPPPAFSIPKMQRIPLYMGIRQAADGTKHFLAIYASIPAWPGASEDITLFGFDCPTHLAPPSNYAAPFGMGRVNLKMFGLMPIPLLDPQVLIYSAVEDPNDKSHLTITMDVNAYRFVEDFSVHSDGMIYGRQQILEWSIGPDGSRTGPPKPMVLGINELEPAP